MLGIAINCEVSDLIVGNFTEKLDELALDNLMQITKDVLSRFCKKDIGDLDLSQITGDSQKNNDNSLTLLGDLNSPAQFRGMVNSSEYKLQNQSLRKLTLNHHV